MNLHQFRHILIITVLLPLVLLLLLALVLAWQIQRTLREQRRIDHTDRITAQLNELERLVVDQETGLRGYQLTRDPTTLAALSECGGRAAPDLGPRCCSWSGRTPISYGGCGRSATATNYGSASRVRRGQFARWKTSSGTRRSI